MFPLVGTNLSPNSVIIVRYVRKLGKVVVACNTPEYYQYKLDVASVASHAPAVAASLGKYHRLFHTIFA